MIWYSNWYDSEKYDLVLKPEYAKKRIAELERYREYLEDKVVKINEEIKKLGET